MLLETQTRPVASGGILQTARATIKSSAKVFNFFSDNTYTMNTNAAIRELAANAVDAHTAANNPEPIEVWLPTDLDPCFRVRDQGIGMSHDFMMTNYTVLGDGSTKDGSDNQIGGFGIGRFSAFALTDQYTVRSIHHGTLSIYSVFKDEEGIPTVGLLGQRPTDEPNGVEVSFPVNPEDFGTFQNAANDALKYFEPLPTLHGGDIDAPHYIARGKGWGMRQSAGDLAVIMGGVRYPVTEYNLDWGLRQDPKLNPLLEYGLDLTIPIGTCGVALSREALAYTDRTNKGLRASLEAIYNEIVESFSTMFDDCPTEWEAKQALMAEAPLAQRYSARAKLLLSNALYRGKPLTVDVVAGGTFWTIDARGRRGSRTVKSANWEYISKNTFNPQSFDYIIIDDLPQSPKSKTIKRIKNFIESCSSRQKPSLVLRDVTFNIDIPDDTFILASDLEAPALEPRVKGERARVRMFAQSSDHNGRSIRQTWSNTTEVSYQDQPDTGILVVCENFEMSYAQYTLLQSGIVGWNEVHFVNKSDAPKLKKWETLEDVAAARLARLVETNPDLPHQLYIRHSTALDTILDKTRYLGLGDLKASRRNSPLGRILTMRERYLDTFNPEHSKLSGLIEHRAPPRLDLDKLRDDFTTKQPLAAHFIRHLHSCVTLKSLDHQILQELI